MGQGLFGEVFQDEVLTSSKRFHKPRHILAPLHRKGSELQPHNSTFRALFQQLYLVLIQLKAHGVFQEGCGLILSEAQGHSPESRLAVPVLVNAQAAREDQLGLEARGATAAEYVPSDALHYHLVTPFGDVRSQAPHCYTAQKAHLK